MIKKILLLEDDIILYENLASFLKNKGFDVLPYTPSYDIAQKHITYFKPDLAVLDIHLQGDKTGFDVAKLLSKKDIPYVFLTSYGDEIHFNTALTHAPFGFFEKSEVISLPDKLYRQLLLIIGQKNKIPEPAERTSSLVNKIGIIGLVDYLDELRKTTEKNKLKEQVIPFEDILYFSTDKRLLYKNKSAFKPNYVYIITKDNRIFFTSRSLADFQEELPHHFQRINDHTIINLTSTEFKGMIHKKEVSIGNKSFPVTQTYYKDFKKKLDYYYVSPKKRRK